MGLAVEKLVLPTIKIPDDPEKAAIESQKYIWRKEILWVRQAKVVPKPEHEDALLPSMGSVHRHHETKDRDN